MNIDSLYNAIMGAEHQGYLGKANYSPWIRTKHQPLDEHGKVLGSTAYGPVQLTGGSGSMLANVARGGVDIGTTPEEMEWIKSRFLPQAQKFLYYGKEPSKEGYQPIYEYGGAGDFTDKDKVLYESVAKKLIASELKRVGGAKNIDKFISAWRDKSYEDDPEYYDFIKEQTMMDDVASEQGSEAF
jgi:hypothetical protein